jgi:hypothetical protein
MNDDQYRQAALCWLGEDCRVEEDAEVERVPAGGSVTCRAFIATDLGPDTSTESLEPHDG